MPSCPWPRLPHCRSKTRQVCRLKSDHVNTFQSYTWPVYCLIRPVSDSALLLHLLHTTAAGKRLYRPALPPISPVLRLEEWGALAAEHYLELPPPLKTPIPRMDSCYETAVALLRSGSEGEHNIRQRERHIHTQREAIVAKGACLARGTRASLRLIFATSRRLFSASLNATRALF